MKLTKVALASGIAFSSLVLPTISYAESTVAFKTTTMYTNHGVHARKAPNIKADIIKTIPKNTKIQVIDGSKKSWYRVLLDGQIVYIYGNYVTSKKPATTPTLPKVVKKGYVQNTNGVQLAVRASASSTGKKIGSLKEGATVQLTKKYTASSKDKFFQIIHNKKVAYVSSKYIGFTKENVRTTKVGVVSNTGPVTLKVRQKPDTTSNILGTLKEGTAINLAQPYKNNNTESWYKITYKGKTAYVAAQYVTLLFPAKDTFN